MNKSFLERLNHLLDDLEQEDDVVIHALKPEIRRLIAAIENLDHGNVAMPDDQQEAIGRRDKFIRAVMADYWEPKAGFDPVELAIDLKLMENVVMQKPCGDNCTCKEHDVEFPIECAQFSRL